MKKDLKEKILDESTKLFLKYGISETGVADISEAVGISKGTLYYHFKNKNAIIHAVADEYFYKVDLMFSTFLKEERVIKNIKSIAKWLVHVITRNAELELMHYMLLSYSVVKCPDLKTKFKNKYTEWTSMISECLDRYKKNDENYFYAKLLLSIIEGVAIRNIIGIDNDSLDTVMLSNLINRLIIN